MFNKNKFTENDRIWFFKIYLALYIVFKTLFLTFCNCFNFSQNFFVWVFHLKEGRRKALQNKLLWTTFLQKLWPTEKYIFYLLTVFFIFSLFCLIIILPGCGKPPCIIRYAQWFIMKNELSKKSKLWNFDRCLENVWVLFETTLPNVS